jgi:hypothetical protein
VTALTETPRGLLIETTGAELEAALEAGWEAGRGSLALVCGEALFDDRHAEAVRSSLSRLERVT